MAPPSDGGRWDSARAHPEVRVEEQGAVFQSSGHGFRTCLCQRELRENGSYAARVHVLGLSNFLAGVALPDVDVGNRGMDRVEFCGRKGWAFYNGERGGDGDEGQAFYHSDQPVRGDDGQIVRCDYARRGETLCISLLYEDVDAGAGELPGTLAFFRQGTALEPVVFRRCIPRGVCFAVTAYHPWRSLCWCGVRCGVVP